MALKSDIRLLNIPENINALELKTPSASLISRIVSKKPNLLKQADLDQNSVEIPAKISQRLKKRRTLKLVHSNTANLPFINSLTIQKPDSAICEEETSRDQPVVFDHKLPTDITNETQESNNSRNLDPVILSSKRPFKRQSFVKTIIVNDQSNLSEIRKDSLNEKIQTKYDHFKKTLQKIMKEQVKRKSSENSLNLNPIKQAKIRSLNNKEIKDISHYAMKKLIHKRKVSFGTGQNMPSANNISTHQEGTSMKPRRSATQSVDVSNIQSKQNSVSEDDLKLLYTSTKRFAPSELSLKTEGEGSKIIQKMFGLTAKGEQGFRSESVKGYVHRKRREEIFSKYAKELMDTQTWLCISGQEYSPSSHGTMSSFQNTPLTRINSNPSNMRSRLINFAETAQRSKGSLTPLEAGARSHIKNEKKDNKLLAISNFENHLLELSKLEGWN